ncbi:hypothetical protein LTR85_004920 [Meristemomyces frigidus]|nr:hypothetical protein LTR85_004920 [Meristemomyces frigidus]
MASLLFPGALWMILLLSIVLHVHGATANCYYPNGDLSDSDAACSSTGGACCPNGWDCLSNGLCYLTNSNYYGRYTCTDETWQSGSCPQICTEGNTASGDEAVLQCYTDHALEPDPGGLQQQQSRIYFRDQRGAIDQHDVRTITDKLDHAFGRRECQLFDLATALNYTRDIDLHISIDDYSERRRMQTASPSATASSHPSDPSTHLGLIIGLAVGIPVFLLACAIIAFILWKRRKANRGQSYLSPPRNSYDDQAMTDKYGHQVGHDAPDGRAPELDSYPVALGRTKSGRHSELEGSGLLHSPATSTGTAPPQYTQSPRSPGLHSVQEESQEPQELWGGYVPYRPPRTELPSEPEASGD